ncbi:ferric reductase NAD binding domain-containing protein [Aspergillus pseudoustus]|uniref:Ferric reductase NAD binding domain-containing protein n=1 Tax=Aspergillus pseudoustus TaxID=1810923 RepID=A0ABR4KCB8_9EURO
MLPKAALLALPLVTVPALAGQGGSQMAADSLEKYCFYSIYTTLTGYTFAGSTIISQSTESSSASQSSSTAHSPSSDTDTSDDQSSSSTAHGSSNTGTSSSGHGSMRARRLLRRGHGSGSTSSGACNSTMEVTSLYASAKAWCNKAQFKVTIPYWQSLCQQNSLTLMDLTAIKANVTEAYIASMPTIDPDMNVTTTAGTIHTPVLLSESYYKHAYKSYVTHDYALSKDKRFGWGLMGYWGGILLLGIVAKFAGFVASRQSAPSPRDSESNGRGMRGPKARTGILSKVVDTPMHYLRTYFVMPASFAPFLTNHQQTYYWHTVPRRMDSLIVFGFWALCIILGFVDYQSFTGNIQISSVFQQNWQYSSNRTGILSYACLPFLWLFGGRNNIFLWATNFNAQSFNIFHHHVAWACTIFAIMHSINYSVVFAYYNRRWDSVWATILMSFMLVQSITILRHKGYETFLIIHVVFAILVVYALFRHTSFDGTKWNGYLWPMVAIWAFDRTVRFVRIAYCNLNVRFGKGLLSPTSRIEYFEDSDLIRVEVFASPALSPGPGQHYSLYQPVTLKGWENHPFTLGAYVLPQSQEDRSKLIFYIRPYDGWTRRLRDQCRKGQNGIIQPKLLLEGPYSHTAPLHTFDTVLIIVGGTGIAAAVPYIIDHVSRLAEGRTRTLKIKLVWSARTNGIYSRIFCSELSTLLHHETISTRFYCTKATSLPDAKSETTSNSSSDAVATTGSVTEKKGVDVSGTPVEPMLFLTGRPEVHSLVASKANKAKASCGRLAVLTCGPAQIADDCRQTVYKIIKGGFRDIEYYKEAFGW